MGIHIAVCIKRTPSSTSVAIDESGQIQTAGLPHGINPFDEYAIEEALRIKEKLEGSKVTIISAGAPESEDVVKAALALGADEGVVVTDPAFDGSDTMVTSLILSKTVEKLGDVKLILFGKQTNDGESGHMTALVGARLGRPSISAVRKVTDIDADSITVQRLMDDGADTLKLNLPAVVGVTKEINEPRLPSLKGKMRAKKAAIPKWGAGDIGVDAAVVGKDASPTGVVKMEPVPARTAGTAITGETPEELAKNLVEKLKETKFI
ncbi:MAG: electron transfer flavoprotein subunit beta [Elusimicrobia bacterium]|nr:MAG: electron transfer flavoprotein subunit beta [Elusimicrobiota bacterium]